MTTDALQGGVTYGIFFTTVDIFIEKNTYTLHTALPSLHPGFGWSILFVSFVLHDLFLAIPTEKDGGNHTPAFTNSAATIEAHNACLDVTKALAATGIRVVLDDEFFAQVLEGLQSRDY